MTKNTYKSASERSDIDCEPLQTDEERMEEERKDLAFLERERDIPEILPDTCSQDYVSTREGFAQQMAAPQIEGFPEDGIVRLLWAKGETNNSKRKIEYGEQTKKKREHRMTLYIKMNNKWYKAPSKNRLTLGIRDPDKWLEQCKEAIKAAMKNVKKDGEPKKIRPEFIAELEKN